MATFYMYIRKHCLRLICPVSSFHTQSFFHHHRFSPESSKVPLNHMSLVVRKPVFGVSDQARHKAGFVFAYTKIRFSHDAVHISVAACTLCKSVTFKWGAGRRTDYSVYTPGKEWDDPVSNPTPTVVYI